MEKLNTTTLAEAEKRIGQHIKSDHPYAYRSGQWATIVDAREGSDRNYWILFWPDGKTDTWVVDDATADYQFRDPFKTAADAVDALEALGEITEALEHDILTPGIRPPRELRERLAAIIENYVHKTQERVWQ